jgi:hypothetical protein
MATKTKYFLFVALFLVISFSYLVWVCFSPRGTLAQFASMIDMVWANLIILVISFLLLSLGFTELVDYSYSHAIRWKRRRSKFGEILVSEGYITKNDLKVALAEQKMRIGEVLIQAGRITTHQLHQALNHQKKVSKKLGEILRSLGYATEEDIEWALERMDRKLGEILRDRGLLSDYELQQVFALRH